MPTVFTANERQFDPEDIPATGGEPSQSDRSFLVVDDSRRAARRQTARLTT